MREAQRSYEANLSVIEASKTLLMRTIEILRGIRGVRPTRRVELLPFVATSSTINTVRDRTNPFEREPVGREPPRS